MRNTVLSICVFGLVSCSLATHKTTESYSRSKSIKSFEPVQNATDIIFIVFRGSELSESEFKELRDQFTDDGFKSLVESGFTYSGLGPNISNKTEQELQEIFRSTIKEIADMIKNSIEKGDLSEPEPWRLEDIDDFQQGEKLSDYFLGKGEYLTKQFYFKTNLDLEDRIFIMNDPFGDDESYIFVVTEENDRWKIAYLHL